MRPEAPLPRSGRPCRYTLPVRFTLQAMLEEDVVNHSLLIVGQRRSRLPYPLDVLFPGRHSEQRVQIGHPNQCLEDQASVASGDLPGSGRQTPTVDAPRIIWALHP